VLGRDCWNEADCVWITRDMASRYAAGQQQPEPEPPVIPLDPEDYDRLPPDDLYTCMECGGLEFVVRYDGDEPSHEECPTCVGGKDYSL
jgi:hypothetical protein